MQSATREKWQRTQRSCCASVYAHAHKPRVHTYSYAGQLDVLSALNIKNYVKDVDGTKRRNLKIANDDMHRGQRSTGHFSPPRAPGPGKLPPLHADAATAPKITFGDPKSYRRQKWPGSKRLNVKTSEYNSFFAIWPDWWLVTGDCPVSARCGAAQTQKTFFSETTIALVEGCEVHDRRDPVTGAIRRHSSQHCSLLSWVFVFCFCFLLFSGVLHRCS